MKDPRKKRPWVDIQMTPMIDAVFLLLIFFMVATSFSPIPGIRVKLPPPGVPQSSSKPETLILRISDPEPGNSIGVMVLNDNIISIDRVLTAFQGATLKQKDMLIIQSGRSVFHEQIVTVMDLAKRSDIKKIGFAMVAREGM
ncbi:MAG: biopolymer transport protein ExbD [Candidatus Poribacteria bacterium]|nr:biopolymer transport protein ExbD [Candidatus Poribacteria bacterium]